MKVNYEYCDNYLFLEYSGTYDSNKMMSELDKSLKICSDSGYSKIIIDVFGLDFKTVPEMGRYDVGLKLAEFRNLLIAILIKKNDFNKFAENVAVNRGANIKHFHDKKYALDWLLK